MTSTDDRDANDWDAEAATFDNEPDHGLRDADVRAAWTELLLKVLPPAPASVLDIGCGTGTLSVLLAEQGYAVTGVDSSSPMLDRASAKAQQSGVDVHLMLGDASDPPVTGRFDVVLCRHILWSLPNTEIVLQNWRRLRTENGRLVLIEGQWDTGAGIRAEDLMTIVSTVVGPPQLLRLTDPRLWGRPIKDDRYLVVARAAIAPDVAPLS